VSGSWIVPKETAPLHRKGRSSLQEAGYTSTGSLAAFSVESSLYRFVEFTWNIVSEIVIKK